MQDAIFKIHGISESKIVELLTPLELGNSTKMSIRAHFPDLALHLTSLPGSGEPEFNVFREQVNIILGDFIYARTDIRLEEVVGSLLSEKKLTLALAESCTGGLIAHRITRVPGSSAYFVGGSVSY